MALAGALTFSCCSIAGIGRLPIATMLRLTRRYAS